MKPVPFAYSRAASLEQACELLLADDGARIIAGGQTLIPMLAMRLARPTRLIDISRIASLSFIRADDDAVAIGAATRQVVAERSDVIRSKLPLLSAGLRWVGHPPTRARGTVGGSVANADPSAEIALVAATLGATLVYREGEDETETPASEWFFGPMVTALPAQACLTELRFPIWSEGRVGVGFHEISTRPSDYALVAAAAQVALDADGTCTRIALGIGGAGDYPISLDAAIEPLLGTRLDEAAVREASRAAMADVETTSDLHASGDYRRRVATTLLIKAVADARASASRDAPGGEARGAH